ncbi:hypothetical protein [Halomonas mongoliensis]|jgi:hypothetical protein|uniref:hypothetical protein n=1 Tax=Halomonas mongoliensis TaxID=321265 RepID=UPI00403AD42E
MNLQRAYRLLAVFYSLLLLIGLIALLAGGGTPLALAQLVVGGLAVVGLWGYVLQRGFMGPRMWRPLAGVLAVGAALQLFALLATSPDGVTATWMLTSAVFSALLVVILYRYGDRDQAIWATAKAIADGHRLETKLAGKAPLEGHRRDGGREASVRVVKAGSEYRTRVVRRRDGRQEEFDASFHHPATLVAFLEQFTELSVEDLTPAA